MWGIALCVALIGSQSTSVSATGVHRRYAGKAKFTDALSLLSKFNSNPYALNQASAAPAVALTQAASGDAVDQDVANLGALVGLGGNEAATVGTDAAADAVSNSIKNLFNLPDQAAAAHSTASRPAPQPPKAAPPPLRKAEALPPKPKVETPKVETPKVVKAPPAPKAVAAKAAPPRDLKPPPTPARSNLKKPAAPKAATKAPMVKKAALVARVVALKARPAPKVIAPKPTADSPRKPPWAQAEAAKAKAAKAKARPAAEKAVHKVEPVRQAASVRPAHAVHLASRPSAAKVPTKASKPLPAVTKPSVATKPVTVKPAPVAKLAAAKPSVVKPVVAKPVAAKPTVVKPVAKEVVKHVAVAAAAERTAPKVVAKPRAVSTPVKPATAAKKIPRASPATLKAQKSSPALRVPKESAALLAEKTSEAAREKELEAELSTLKAKLARAEAAPPQPQPAVQKPRPVPAAPKQHSPPVRKSVETPRHARRQAEPAGGSLAMAYVSSAMGYQAAPNPPQVKADAARPAEAVAQVTRSSSEPKGDSAVPPPAAKPAPVAKAHTVAAVPATPPAAKLTTTSALTMTMVPVNPPVLKQGIITEAVPGAPPLTFLGSIAHWFHRLFFGADPLPSIPTMPPLPDPDAGRPAFSKQDIEKTASSATDDGLADVAISDDFSRKESEDVAFIDQTKREDRALRLDAETPSRPAMPAPVNFVHDSGSTHISNFWGTLADEDADIEAALTQDGDDLSEYERLKKMQDAKVVESVSEITSEVGDHLPLERRALRRAAHHSA